MLFCYPQEAWQPATKVGTKAFARGFRVHLFVSLLLLPIAVHGQTDSTMKGYLLSVSNLYSALEYEKALEQIGRAKRFARTTSDDITLSIYEGIILADLNRWDESSAAFKAALFLNPEAKLPLVVSPKVQSSFESIRQVVKRELASAKPLLLPHSALPESMAEKPVEQENNSRGLSTNNKLVPPSASPETSGRQFTRPHVLIPAISGGVLILAGSTSWLLSRRELSLLRSNDEQLATPEDIHRSASRGKTYQTIGLSLLGTGVVAVGVATAFFFDSHDNQVALGFSPNGRFAVMVGTWP